METGGAREAEARPGGDSGDAEAVAGPEVTSRDTPAIKNKTDENDSTLTESSDASLTVKKPSENQNEEVSSQNHAQNGVNTNGVVTKQNGLGEPMTENGINHANVEAEEPIDVETTDNNTKDSDTNETTSKTTEEEPLETPAENVKSTKNEEQANEEEVIVKDAEEVKQNGSPPDVTVTGAEIVEEETKIESSETQVEEKEESPAPAVESQGQDVETKTVSEAEAGEEAEKVAESCDTESGKTDSQAESEPEKVESSNDNEATVEGNTATGEVVQTEEPLIAEVVDEVKDVSDVEQVQVKIALGSDENVECVLENVAVGDEVTTTATTATTAAEVHDQLEENLENFAPVPAKTIKTIKPVKAVKAEEPVEAVLVDDEEMVVTQITSIDELATNGHGQTQVIITTEAKVEQGDSNIDQFTETEDLVIYALDTISPFDVKFISQHMANRDEHQIERRLTDQTFRKKSFSFQKVPYLMFELVFVSESNDRSSSLMILTQRKLIQLKCKNTWCQYGPGIETIEMNYNPRTRFGIDTGALCEFIITNIPNMHMPYLRRNVREIEAFMEESGIHFRSANRKVDLKQILNRVQPEITMESLRMEGMPLIKIDEAGVLHLKEEHEEMLVKIVKAVGRNHWEEGTKLLIAVFEYEVDVDIDDEEIFDKVRTYFDTKLDPDLKSGPFTEDEDKCIIFMYKYWSKIMDDEDVWRNIARHLEGRTANQVKNRFQRKSGCATDYTLENILNYPDDPSNPATFNNDLAHMFSLTVVKKQPEAPEVELTTRLQQEDCFLVMGTMRELFIRPCRDTAIKTKYPGVVPHTFTYDPARPPEQFLSFVKLTFGNGLKKLGLVDRPDTFNHQDIAYRGETIHQLIRRADAERFCVPKDVFMRLNRRVLEGGEIAEFRLPVKRKYTRKIDKTDLHQRRDAAEGKLDTAKRYKYFSINGNINIQGV